MSLADSSARVDGMAEGNKGFGAAVAVNRVDGSNHVHQEV